MILATALGLLAASGCRSDVGRVADLVAAGSEPAWKAAVIRGEPPLSGPFVPGDSPIYAATPVEEARSRILVYVPRLEPILVSREQIQETVGLGELHRFASEEYQVELYYFEARPGEAIAKKDNGHLLAGLNLWSRWRATPVVPGEFGVANSPFGAMGFVHFKPVFGLSCFTALQYLDPVERPDGHFRRVFRMYYCKRAGELRDSEIRSVIAGVGVVGLNEPSPSLQPAGAEAEPST